MEHYKDHYNAVAQELGLPSCRALTPARRKQINARIAEIGEDGLHEAIEKLRDSSFCQGANGRGWRANFDFVLQASSCIKLLEGAYDDRPEIRKKTNLERAMADAFKGTSGEIGVESNSVLPFVRKSG